MCFDTIYFNHLVLSNKFSFFNFRLSVQYFSLKKKWLIRKNYPISNIVISQQKICDIIFKNVK